MMKSSSVMLHPELLNRIGSQLREKSEDIYLLFRILIETGYTAQSISQMTVKDMKCFIDRNVELLSSDLVEYLKLHMEYLGEDDYFFVGQRSRDHNKPLSKRSYENLIREIGMNHDVNDLGVKSLSRSFFYSHFRNSQYDFSALKKLMSSRNRNIKDLPQFLKLCDISMEEMEEDRKRYLEASIDRLCESIDGVISDLQRRRELFSSGGYQYEDLLETIRIIDNV